MAAPPCPTGMAPLLALPLLVLPLLLVVLGLALILLALLAAAILPLALLVLPLPLLVLPVLIRHLSTPVLAIGLMSSSRGSFENRRKSSAFRLGRQMEPVENQDWRRPVALYQMNTAQKQERVLHGAG